MTLTDASAVACEVDSDARSALVQTSADARVRRFATRTPVPPARARRSNVLVEIGDNGLVDLRVEPVIRRLAEFALEYCEGSVGWAADELGVNPSTLRRWLYQWAREAPALSVVPGGALEEVAP